MITAELQTLQLGLAAEEQAQTRGILGHLRDQLKILRQNRAEKQEEWIKTGEIKTSLRGSRHLTNLGEWIKTVGDYFDNVIHHDRHENTMAQRSDQIMEKITAETEDMRFLLAQKRDNFVSSANTGLLQTESDSVQAQLTNENALHTAHAQEMRSLALVVKDLIARVRSQIDKQMAAVKKQGIMNKVFPYVSTVVMTVMAVGMPALVATMGIVVAATQKIVADLLMAAGMALFNTGKTFLQQGVQDKIKSAAARADRLEKNQQDESARQQQIKSQKNWQDRQEQKITNRFFGNL